MEAREIKAREAEHERLHDEYEDIFDTASGISLDEQQAVRAEIQSIAERCRHLQVSSGGHPKKRGALFPALANLCALGLLGGAFFLFFPLFLPGRSGERADSAYRAAARLAAKALHTETRDLIGAKDQEIAGLSAEIGAADEELRNLRQSLDQKIRDKEAALRSAANRDAEAEQARLIHSDLSSNRIIEEMRRFEEQKEERLAAELAAYREQLGREAGDTETSLRRQQEARLQKQAASYGERARLIENARIKEENLLMEFGGFGETETPGAVPDEAPGNPVQEELMAMAGERERAQRIEEELSGFCTLLAGHIKAGNLQKAADTLALARTFINTPSFQRLRYLNERRGFYLSVLDGFSALADDRLRGTAPAPPVSPDQTGQEALEQQYARIITEMKAQYAELEQAANEKDAAIAALEAQSRRASSNAGGPADQELKQAVNALKMQNASLQQAVNTRDATINTLRAQVSNAPVQSGNSRDINALQTQNASLQQAVNTRDAAINTLRAQNTSLQQAAGAYENRIKELRSQTETLQQSIVNRESALSALRSQNSNLQQSLNARDAVIAELRSQSAASQQTVSSRDSAMNTLRSQNASLLQTVSSHENTIKDLRSQTESLQQAAANRDTTINALRSQNSNLQQSLNARDAAIAELRSQSAASQQAVSSHDSAISALRTQNANLSQSLSALEADNSSLRAQTGSLQQIIAGQDSAINDLRGQNIGLQQSLASRDSAINSLRGQNMGLQQSLTSKDSAINDLRNQNTALNQTVEQLRQTNEALRRIRGN
ncbi:MAG: hypothetical protein LBD13_06570 [Spirochaetaceae bacterium]|jgi:predicted  nucleic acid-binding Zn-ribbon protein|nr:hypothetical protein [Spirochaetaceae bacterium]